MTQRKGSNNELEKVVKDLDSLIDVFIASEGDQEQGFDAVKLIINAVFEEERVSVFDELEYLEDYFIEFLVELNSLISKATGINSQLNLKMYIPQTYITKSFYDGLKKIKPESIKECFNAMKSRNFLYCILSKLNTENEIDKKILEGLIGILKYKILHYVGGNIK